ncbi:hypothetical protein [Demequina sp.]|uniref:lipase family protein n=1 Tax=Demequina sp. TaxID=2050685 RepID=UPI0025FB83EF|nr:hypothetical protein [Demequina sp.]
MSQESAWTTGGRGGTAAVTEDLEIAAHALDAAAADLEDAATALAVASHLVGWHSGIAEPGPLGWIASAASHAAAELRATSAAVAGAARAYLDAEEEARAQVGLSVRAADAAGDWAGSLVWGLRWVQALSYAVTPLGAVVGGPGGLVAGPLSMIRPQGQPPTTGVLHRDTVERALAGDQYDRMACTLTAAVTAAEALEPGYVGVEGARATPAFEPPASVESLITRMRWTADQGDGTVAIETVVGADGRARHLVYIPGTQDWGVTDANPADLQADLASVRGGASDAARTVVDAMAAHRIGPDEPVMLAGHSQGGIVAVVAAAALVDRYRVTHVVTAGSPTGRLALPARVEALHLENTRDVVPGLDGRPNPDSAHRVTVSHDRRRSTARGAADASRTAGEAHGTDGYATTARLVDQGLSASTRSWMDGARAFLDGGRSTLTAYRPVAG